MNITYLIFSLLAHLSIIMGAFCITIIILILYAINKRHYVSVLKNNIEYLNNAIEELDHQAKLIIKNDMELKLYQEEVEDKLNKLTLVKNLIISSIHILDKEDLFSLINEKIINDLGFKKSLILNFNDLKLKNNVNFTPQEIEIIQNFIAHKKEALKSLSVFSGDEEICQNLVSALHSSNFLISPIQGRENIHAVFVIFSPIFAYEIEEAEKVILSVICMYLGQCLDNIKMFEEIYMAKDELEKKIKERTNELAKSLREIEIISKTKSDFISSVSHELRTPLTSVKGFSSLLVAGKFGELPPEAKKRLEQIDSNVNKLVDMVNMLLDISRIESGKAEVKIAPADIAKLIRDTGDFLSPQMQAKKLHFNTEIPQSLNVFMDKNLIERVLINLINNALKFTPQEGKITVKCIKQKDGALISISDTGCGIEKDDLEKVFQEFYRTRVTQKIPGTGLGLSLVKRIISTHKGKLWVESEIGKGSTFYFTLKLEKPG